VVTQESPADARERLGYIRHVICCTTRHLQTFVNNDRESMLEFITSFFDKHEYLPSTWAIAATNKAEHLLRHVLAETQGVRPLRVHSRPTADLVDLAMCST
jgi:hypothetical protein